MKAPDKLWLNKYMIRPDMLRPAQYPPDTPDFEYIRKDALLDWLQPRANELKQRWWANPADEEAFHKQIVFSSIIDKLKSM